MKPTLEAEYAAEYVVTAAGLPSRESMLSAVKYYRRLERSGLWRNGKGGRGNRAVRRFVALLNRPPEERKYNWFCGLSWHAGNRLGLCHASAVACHLC